MKLLPLFFLGLLGLFFIALLSFKFNEPIIENELTENTHEALLSEGVDWATPSANGQTITLKGIADNNELRLQAESIARAVNGVTQVNNQLTVASSENITHQTTTIIMVNEGNDGVDSISAATLSEVAVEAEVEVIATDSIEPIAEITEIAETESAVTVESVDSIEAVTDIAVETVESTESAETEAPEAIAISEPVNAVLDTCQQQFDQLLQNEKIRFETNSAILSAGNGQLLTKLAEIIQSCPAFKTVIEGHTDTDGEVIANQILSEQRAYRVYDELVKRGIRSSSLLAIGYGESRPLSTDNTSESKAQNRRIEFNVQEN